MQTFVQWVENNDWFNQSTYEIAGQVYSVPKLAEWAKKNLRITKIPVKAIQQKYVWADKLFVDNDDPNGDWASRSMNTQLSFPILMLEYPNGSWEIIDGNHRTWKAWKSGMDHIEGYLIHLNQIPPPDQI